MSLLDGLRDRGITLEADGDRLRLRGPADQLTPELCAELAGYKAEILTHLRRRQSTVYRGPGDPYPLCLQRDRT